MAGIDDELDKELEKLFRENLLNVPYTTKRVIKKIKTMILKAQAEARLGMVEYYDQVSNNKDMDWKGLFADNRKLIEQERKALLITQQTQEAFKKGRIDAYGYALGRLEKPFLKETPSTAKPKRGRPTEIKRDITKTSQSGLREGLTRATFIIREDTLDRLKQRAYDDRKKLKDIVTEALDYYLDKTKTDKDGSERLHEVTELLEHALNQLKANTNKEGQ